MKARKINSPTTRNGWLKKLYQEQVLAANEATRNFSDKLFAARYLEKHLGNDFLRFHPKTLGLRQFVLKYDLLKNDSSDHQEKLRNALLNEFPKGCIVKPCAAINSGGETEQNYFFMEDIYRAFEKGGALQVSAAQTEPFYSPLLESVVSGEEYILQENISTLGGYQAQKAKTYSEIRVHTFENQLVPGGLYHRWQVSPVQDQKKFGIAEKLVQDLLAKIPGEELTGVAWGLDVIVLDNGLAKIIDINTNRGLTKQWSGYLSRPELIGAYSRLIEQKYNIHFSGFKGIILRNNFGNYWKYKKKYYIEGIR